MFPFSVLSFGCANEKVSYVVIQDLGGALWEVERESNVLVEIDSSVGKLAEGAALLDLSGLLGVLHQNFVSTLALSVVGVCHAEEFEKRASEQHTSASNLEYHLIIRRSYPIL